MHIVFIFFYMKIDRCLVYIHSVFDRKKNQINISLCMHRNITLTFYICILILFSFMLFHRENVALFVCDLNNFLVIICESVVYVSLMCLYMVSLRNHTSLSVPIDRLHSIDLNGFLQLHFDCILMEEL